VLFILVVVPGMGNDVPYWAAYTLEILLGGWCQTRVLDG